MSETTPGASGRNYGALGGMKRVAAATVATGLSFMPAAAQDKKPTPPDTHYYYTGHIAGAGKVELGHGGNYALTGLAAENLFLSANNVFENMANIKTTLVADQVGRHRAFEALVGDTFDGAPMSTGRLAAIIAAKNSTIQNIGNEVLIKLNDTYVVDAGDRKFEIGKDGKFLADHRVDPSASLTPVEKIAAQRIFNANYGAQGLVDAARLGGVAAGELMADISTVVPYLKTNVTDMRIVTTANGESNLVLTYRNAGLAKADLGAMATQGAAGRLEGNQAVMTDLGPYIRILRQRYPDLRDPAARERQINAPLREAYQSIPDLQLKAAVQAKLDPLINGPQDTQTEIAALKGIVADLRAIKEPKATVAAAAKAADKIEVVENRLASTLDVGKPFSTAPAFPQLASDQPIKTEINFLNKEDEGVIKFEGEKFGVGGDYKLSPAQWTKVVATGKIFLEAMQRGGRGEEVKNVLPEVMGAYLLAQASTPNGDGSFTMHQKSAVVLFDKATPPGVLDIAKKLVLANPSLSGTATPQDGNKPLAEGGTIIHHASLGTSGTVSPANPAASLPTLTATNARPSMRPPGLS